MVIIQSFSLFSENVATECPKSCTQGNLIGKERQVVHHLTLTRGRAILCQSVRTQRHTGDGVVGVEATGPQGDVCRSHSLGLSTLVRIQG